MPDQDLHELMAAIEGDDPSPEFVSSLRTQLEAELIDDPLGDGDVHLLTLVDAQPVRERQPMTRKWWIGGIATAAAAVLILVGIVAFNDGGDDVTVASDGDNGEPGVDGAPPVMSVAEGQTLMDTFVAALQAGDAETARSLVVDDGGPGPDFLGWLITLDTTGVEFFDCTHEPGSASCQTTMGVSHWFERIHGQNVENRFAATLEDGLIVNPTWPVQPADVEAERAFRTWAQETHPELDDVMFDPSFTTFGAALTVESGQARMQLIDDYLIHRAEQAVDALVSAFRANDAEAARAVVVGGGGSPDFIGWVTTLDTSAVEFFDCEYEPASVTCQTRLGANHWFERIHGQNVEQPFNAAIRDGVIVNPQWPAHTTNLTAEREFRTWAEETHPELDDVMFDTSPQGFIFTVESAEARMLLIDEFLASL